MTPFEIYAHEEQLEGSPLPLRVDVHASPETREPSVSMNINAIVDRDWAHRSRVRLTPKEARQVGLALLFAANECSS